MNNISIACAVICEKDEKILMVKEFRQGEGITYNQPVGKMNTNESIFEAAIREYREETGYIIILKKLLGIYSWQINNEKTSIRFCFIGEIISGEIKSKHKDGHTIIEPIWVDRRTIFENETRFRNSIAKKCLKDYFKGISYPIESITNMGNE